MCLQISVRKKKRRRKLLKCFSAKIKRIGDMNVKSLNTDDVSDRSRLGLEFMSRVNTIVRMVTIDRIYTVSSWPCISTKRLGIVRFNTGR